MKRGHEWTAVVVDFRNDKELARIPITVVGTTPRAAGEKSPNVLWQDTANSVRVYDVAGKQLSGPFVHKDLIAASISPNAEWILTADKLGTWKLWNRRNAVAEVWSCRAARGGRAPAGR